MKMIQKHRIYPNKTAEIQLLKQEGCNRKVWNETLTHMHRLGYWLSYNEMSKYLTHTLKPKFTYLYDVCARSLQQSLKDLDRAVKNHTRKNNGKKWNPPKFKKKTWRKSCRFPQHAKIDKKNNLLYLIKIWKNPIRIVLERDLPEYTMCTIVKESDNKWYAFFIIEKETKLCVKQKETKYLGIDLGINNFITTSEGDKIKSPKLYQKSESSISKSNKALAKKKYQSRRWLKVRKRLSSKQAKIRRRRHDWIHKLSHQIASNDNVEAVCVETLKIQHMMEERKINLSKNISDAGWGMFVECLEYKLLMRGKLFDMCHSTYPSTQLCSSCHKQTGPKNLATRNWTCTSCHTTHDRDINAAINVANYPHVKHAA